MKTLSFLTAVIVLSITSCGEGRQSGPSPSVTTSLSDSAKVQLVDCCIKPSCDICVEKFGKCTCLEDLKAGKAICGECIHGYKEGKGKLKLIAIPELKKRAGT